MKKVSNKFFLLSFILILTAGCGYIPPDLTGTWKLSSGTIKSSYSNTTDVLTTDYKSGTLKIENEKFDWTYETESTDSSGNVTKEEVSMIGDVSANYTEKTITLNATEYTLKITETDSAGNETQYKYDMTGKTIGSLLYKYVISGLNLTLTNESDSEINSVKYTNIYELKFTK